MRKNKDQINVWITRQTHAQLKRMAEEEDRSMCNMAAYLIEIGLKQYNRYREELKEKYEI